MDLLFHEMPDKKWYIILDDDTYLVRPSLKLLLDHLDHHQPLYIGNAVGDYRGRFAHGGSGVVLSGEAMRRLFSNPDVVKRAYIESLDEIWGDKLVATTLQKVGVYLDERFNHHFNGEYPAITRIAADRFCSPIVSFHGLRQQGEMAEVGRALGPLSQPLLWSQVWDVFGKYPVDDLALESAQVDQDHVGGGGDNAESRAWRGVHNAAACQAKCEGDKGMCLAWTFVPGEGTCMTSSWMIIGDDNAQGKISGVNWQRLDAMRRLCTPSW
jgi:hypothetical protein